MPAGAIGPPASVATVAEALAAIGRAPATTPARPVLHGRAGTLLTVGLLGKPRSVTYSGAFVTADGVSFVGPSAEESGLSAALESSSGAARRLTDLLAEAGRLYLERTEEIDAALATAEQHTRSVPLPEIWAMHREAALIEAQVGRALVATAELEGPLGRAFPGLERTLPSIVAELNRASALCAQVRQALSDLILLRNAEASNRIAALANTSNIRMLGLTYVALLLGLVSAVVLIPNTAATILGMPSAAWVPGLWVDLILVVLAVVPLLIVFSRRWVLSMLEGWPTYESRAREGLVDLPEVSPDVAASPEGFRTPPPAGTVTPPR